MSDDEINVDEAMANIIAALKDFDNQTPENQMRLRSLVTEMQRSIELHEMRERERKQAKAAQKREKAQARKELRDELIPAWCEENLKPGMIIKVKAKNSGFRRVTEVKPHRILGSTGFRIEGEVRGQHVGWVRRKNLDTGEIRTVLTEGDYITDHILTNVQGVVLTADAQRRGEVTPIMELIEGGYILRQVDGKTVAIKSKDQA